MSYEVLRQITQYLLSPKCATAFGKWTSDTIKLGGKIDKDIIIRTVSQLESYAELKLYSPRMLPGSLITTTLGLPVGTIEQTVNAHFVNPPKPVDFHWETSDSQQCCQTWDSQQCCPFPDHSSPWLFCRQTAFSTSTESNSGKQQEQRGRSPEKSSSSSTAHSANIELDPALECLQYYSRYSTSPNPVRKQFVPGIFRRALTPKSKEHLKTTYFYSTSGDTKFKDVREKGHCLRCYGSDHRASTCQVYTRPTPTPCRHCMHLKKCISGKMTSSRNSKSGLSSFLGFQCDLRTLGK
jgi:hypothetical protein